MPSLKRNLYRLFIAITFLFSTAVFSDDFKEASILYEQGKLDLALEKVNALLTQQPKDAQTRFLKALIFTDQKKIPEAIQILIGLTEDYPKLPEPYNNLAVLYASQGKYDEARAALELAIHIHPGYTTAYENLGDIYTQLARRSYESTLQLDKSNTNVNLKKSTIKRLSEDTKVAVTPGLTKDNVQPTPLKALPQARIDTGTTLNTAPPIQSTDYEDKPTNHAAKEQIRAIVNAWAKSWSARQVEGYLAFYAPNFEMPLSDRREEWERVRRYQDENPKENSVTIKIIYIVINAAGNESYVVLRQSYRLGELKNEIVKTFKLMKYGEKWLIRAERTGTFEPWNSR